MLKVDPAFLALLVGSLLPLATGLLTKLKANRGLQSVVTLTLASLTGVIVQAQHAGGVFTKQTVLAAGLAYIAAISTHYGLWKPTGVSDAVALVAPNSGLGTAK